MRSREAAHTVVGRNNSDSTLRDAAEDLLADESRHRQNIGEASGRGPVGPEVEGVSWGGQARFSAGQPGDPQCFANPQASPKA